LRERSCELGGVHPCSGELVGNRRHVEQDAHAVTVVCATACESP
jgi:hypothetical protein